MAQSVHPNRIEMDRKVHCSLDCWCADGAEVACPCAHCLLCKVEGDGRSLSFLRFTDEESERTTYGERIEYCPGCGEEPGLVTPFSARARRRGGRHREAAITGGRHSGRRLAILRSDIRCPISVWVMSGKGKGGVGHRISPPRPQVNPRGSRRSSSSARAGPRMGQSMQCGWPLRPILTWRWLVSWCKE